MSALQMKATTLWTTLLQAMQADGLIAHCITQSGPATTKVIVGACQEMQQPVWLPMHMLPNDGVEVVASRYDGAIEVLKRSADFWTGKVGDEWGVVDPASYRGWCFVKFTGLAE